MAFPIDKWIKQAVRKEKKYGPVEGYNSPPKRLMSDIKELAKYNFGFWRARNISLKESGDPLALQGLFAGLGGPMLGGAITGIASLSGTVALWTSSVFTPFTPPMEAPTGWHFWSMGLITTSTSPANLGWDPRFGTGSTQGSAISGTTMGASTNVALTASITSAFWVVEGQVVLRSVGAPGANSTVYGMFNYIGTQATASGLAGPAVVGAGHNLIFGGSTASVDATVAGGFSLGAVHTVTTITYAVHAPVWLSLN